MELNLPMNVRTVVTNDIVKENNSKVAFEYGPIVYCAEEADNKNLTELAYKPGTVTQVKAQSLLGEKINVIDAGNAKLIPYYLWSNRGIGQMKVWLPAGK